MSKVRIGIIGSRFQADCIAGAVKAMPEEGEVVAVASPTKGHAAGFAKRHDIPRAYTDYRELLLSRPATALGDESLPVGLLALLARIEARELGEYARLAIEAEAAYRVTPCAARREEPADLRALSRRAPVGAAA